MGDDFGPVGASPTQDAKGQKRMREDQGEERPWLKVFETLPAQLLSAYGETRYTKMSDQAVWEQMSKPLKSGAKYCSEFCSHEPERRGVAINRWLHAIMQYCR